MEVTCNQVMLWLAGNPLFDDPTHFILARFHANGAIDSTFNSIGYQQYAWDTGAENRCRDMLLLPDGKVLLGGRVMNKASKQNNFGLIRINPDGSEDHTFGINSRLFTQINLTAPEGSADIRKLLLQSDNKILALGTSANTFDPTALSTVVRYHSNGRTSILELGRLLGLNIYPNPAHSILYINQQSPIQISSIQIYNMLGQVVLQMNAPKDNTIAVADLPNACYLISMITSDNMVYRQKLMIQH